VFINLLAFLLPVFLEGEKNKDLFPAHCSGESYFQNHLAATLNISFSRIIFHQLLHLSAHLL
jgi:hypothetical protein